jgi:hypothetical protein
LTVFPYDSHSIETARTVLGLVTKSPVILAYVGPDQIMPITSVLSALVGVALMFWNRIAGFVARTWASFTRRSEAAPAPPAESATDRRPL